MKMAECFAGAPIEAAHELEKKYEFKAVELAELVLNDCRTRLEIVRQPVLS